MFSRKDAIITSEKFQQKNSNKAPPETRISINFQAFRDRLQILFPILNKFKLINKLLFSLKSSESHRKPMIF